MTREVPQPSDGFGFSRNEELFTRVHHRRLMAFVADEKTKVHAVELSSNSYGEFLFVTLSRRYDRQPGYVTFFGLGYHEHRERWITEEWFWYRSTAISEMTENIVDRAEATAQLEERRTEVLGYAAREQPQSLQGKLFELLADLGDDDGAIADLEDFGTLLDLGDE
jgi:hypothetical protein